MVESVRVRKVEGRSGTTRFIDAAWRVYASDGSAPDRRWVAPLRIVVRDALNERKNPFYREAERALFVAERDGRVVGRIAAIENRWHNRYHNDRVGFFGFFDCADDPEAATALLGAAESWLRGRGLKIARGPVSPSMNHESGLLVEGADVPPVIMTPWHPEYVGALIDGAGYHRAKDLLGYDIPATEGLAVPERLGRLAQRTATRTGVQFRTLDLKTLEREAKSVLDLYTEAWEGNWGFVPPDWDDFWHTAKDLKSVVIPEYSFVAEVDGEIVGFMLMARDLNRVLQDVPSGRLWPTTIARLARGLPKVRYGRIVLLGLRRSYRNRGLFPLFAWEAAKLAEKTGFEGAEASWILEDNDALNRPLEAMGLRAYKRWRIYEKGL